ncbi:MAG TPA: DUF971 domain-containing protein [Acidobacteriaceae bacterium]|jgi:DUF971 family protein|nr:DUF971 domain-containing protein [Acidobacteriaceae bacterium]
MSHEGIRFVSADEAARTEKTNAKLHPDTVTPAKVRVKQTEGTGVEIDWKDGHHSTWSFAWLRDACPCATCHESREAEGRKPGEPKPAPAQLLPMFKPPARPQTVTPVGKYAVRFKWEDGHESGIYSWEYLRRVCQCAECTATAK